MTLATSSRITVETVAEVPVAELLATVQRTGYAIVRGLFPKERMRTALTAFRSGFDPTRDHPGVGGTPTDVMGNFQKLIIGSGAQANYPIPRFVRIMYNPIWAEDRYGMRAIFRDLARLRNHIQDHRLDYAVDGIDDHLWTAARLQQYPAGGGFFGAHRDVMSGTTTTEVGLKQFIQIIALVTERGIDFERGGAYIQTAAGRIDLEAENGSGDVLIYDGSSVHGVADIDPHKLPDLTGPSGRVAALATLYKDMRGNAAELERFRTRDFTSKT